MLDEFTTDRTVLVGLLFKRTGPGNYALQHPRISSESSPTGAVLKGDTQRVLQTTPCVRGLDVVNFLEQRGYTESQSLSGWTLDDLKLTGLNSKNKRLRIEVHLPTQHLTRKGLLLKRQIRTQETASRACSRAAPPGCQDACRTGQLAIQVR